MVLLVLCKEALFKVCDVTSIPANLRNSKPWTIFQNSLDFTKFPLTEVSNLYTLFLKTLICKMAR